MYQPAFGREQRAGTRSLPAELVGRVAKRAVLERQAAAADAIAEPVAQALQQKDLVIDGVGPTGRESRPVLFGRRPSLRQAREAGADLGQRDADVLRNPDNGDSAQHLAVVAPLVARSSVRADQALARGDF